MAKSYDRDTFNISIKRPNSDVRNDATTQNDPLTTLKKIQYDSLFASDKIQLTERVAEVLSVELNVKKPSNLSYFGNQAMVEENGQRDWVVAICRIPDFDFTTSQPSLTVQPNNTTLQFNFEQITKIRQHGKFYVLADQLRAKGYTNLEVGDWVVVEFMDKNLLTNGMIKDVFYKKELSTMSPELQKDTTIRAAAAAKGAFDKPGASPSSLKVTPPKNPIFINPIANAGYTLKSLFGIRDDPETGERKQHNGIDLSTPEGVPIYAMEEGVVDEIKNDSMNGNGIAIEHTGEAEGYRSAMIHLLRPPSVRVGDKLKKGQFIGYVGNTGRSFGAHLHLEVRKRGNLIDPTTVIKFDPWVPRDSQFDTSNNSEVPKTFQEIVKEATEPEQSIDRGGIPVSETIDFNGNRVCVDRIGRTVPCLEGFYSTSTN